MSERSPVEVLASILRCPRCNGGLSEVGEGTVCSDCGGTFERHDGVLDLAATDDYRYAVGSVTQEVMEALLEDARLRGFNAAFDDFVRSQHERRTGRKRSRARALYRGIWLALNGRRLATEVRTVLFESPAYTWLLTSISPKARVLDLGAGWSSTAHVVARECGLVVAADATLDRLQISSLRAMEAGTRNLVFVRTPTSTRLPFRDSSFDVVMLNGVLEWMPASIQEADPTEIQRRVLAEVLRILRPGGQVHVAIENRFALGDLLGFPEGHTGLPLAGVLPRVLAQPYHQVVKKGPMRVTTHSRRALESLIASAGYDHHSTAVYAPQPTYAWIEHVGAANRRAANVLGRAGLEHHPHIGRRVPARIRRLLRPLEGRVAAFAAVASDRHWESAFEALVARLQTKMDIQTGVPVSELRVRDYKVMFDLARGGEPLHVTMGLSEAGDRLVGVEASQLRAFADLTPVRDGRLVLPSCAWSGIFRGHQVLVLGHVDGRPSRARRISSDEWDLNLAACQLLEDCQRELSSGVTLAQLWQARWVLLASLLPTARQRAQARQVEEALSLPLEEADLAAVVGHGDLNPGNLLRIPNSNAVGIIDWETAGPSHPSEDRFRSALFHMRATTHTIGRAFEAVLQSPTGHAPPALRYFLPDVVGERALLRAFFFAWTRTLSNVQGTPQLRSPEWLDERAWRILDLLGSRVEQMGE